MESDEQCRICRKRARRLSGFVSLDAVYTSRINFDAAPDPLDTNAAATIFGGRLGVRSDDGRYEVSIFVRNMFDQYRPIVRFATPTAAEQLDPHLIPKSQGPNRDVWWASPWAANFNQRLGALVNEVQASPMSADELDPRFYVAPLRERDSTLPAALCLLSPVTDLASNGDTNVTLASVDYLEAGIFDVARRAYAPGAQLGNPLVSPAYGDFTRDFPPVLIHAGTRELLLSDSVRMHRALASRRQGVPTRAV